MGANFARDLADFVSAGPSNPCLDLRQAVIIHLTTNHFPPAPRALADACLSAISLANDGLYDEPVSLPDGILWRDQETAPAGALIESFHLEYFLD